MSKPDAYFLPESFQALASQEESSWWFQSRNRLILWAINKYVPPFKQYLEIGCGTGYVLRGIHQKFPNVKIVGAEYFEEGLEIAKLRTPEAEFIQLDATKMTTHDSYDLVGLFDVLEHITEDELVLGNIHSSLVSGGHLAITVPQHMWLWSPSDDYAQHVRRYSFNELLNKVKKANFEIQLCTSFVTFLLPVMWLNRAVSKGKTFDPEAEFRMHPIANWLLRLIMTFEIFFIRAGIRFGAGGSILLIASKKSSNG